MAPLPKPIAGLVIRYSFLWSREHDVGRKEGIKDRPCTVVLAVERAADATVVIVLPVTHSPPLAGEHAIEIPTHTKRRLGLDGERSWIVLDEANEFVWPGFDIRPIRPEDGSSIVYGELPADFFRDLRYAFVRTVRAKRARVVPRP